VTLPARLAAAASLVLATAVFAQPRVNVAMHASAAERLATLAERIGKDQLQVAQGLLAARSRRSLRDAIREFDALLAPVQALAGDAEARDNFVLLALLWKETRAWAQKPATRENARELSERVDELAWVASKGAGLLRPDGTAQRAAVQAMHAATLALRLARLHLLARGAPADTKRREEARDTEARLTAIVASLADAPHDGDIEEALHMARTQHDFLRAAVGDLAAGGGAGAAEAIAKTADHVADSMERAARLYENAPAA
jgi:hypothetical protein